MTLIAQVPEFFLSQERSEKWKKTIFILFSQMIKCDTCFYIHFLKYRYRYLAKKIKNNTKYWNFFSYFKKINVMVSPPAPPCLFRIRNLYSLITENKLVVTFSILQIIWSFEVTRPGLSISLLYENMSYAKFKSKF